MPGLALQAWWKYKASLRTYGLTEVDLFSQALGDIGQYHVLTESDVVISTASATNPIVITTATAHGYSTGDLVLITDLVEMTEINNQVFRIRSAAGSTFGIDRDGSSYTAEVSGGTANKLIVNSAVTEAFDRYSVVREEVLSEFDWNCATSHARLARLGTAKTITAVTQATQAVVTSAAHGYAQGDLVFIDGVLGMIQLNGRWFTLGTVATNTFVLSGEDSTNYDAYTSGGTAQKSMTPLRPDSSYTYRYTVPTDMLRFLNISQPGYEDAQAEHVGTEIFTDVGPTVMIRYTKNVLDPRAYSAQLFAYLATRLAYRMAWRLTQSAAILDRAEKRVEQKRREAMHAEGRHPSHSDLVESSWTTGRR